jgi:hypothetical protein
VIPRQPVGIVVHLNCRNEGGRGHGDRGSLRLLHMMKSVVMPNRVVGRVRRERRKSEAHRNNDRREFHFVLQSKKPSTELDFIK